MCAHVFMCVHACVFRCVCVHACVHMYDVVSSTGYMRYILLKVWSCITYSRSLASWMIPAHHHRWPSA